jgi:hypothetical protein
LIVVRADRQRSRHTARMIDYASRPTCGSVLRIPARLGRAPRAADMFAVVTDVSPQRPRVVRIGGLTASSQISTNPADPTPPPPSRRPRSSLLNRDDCAFNYFTTAFFDVSVSKSPGPGAAGIVFEAAPVGAKKCDEYRQQLENRRPAADRRQTATRLRQFRCRGGPAGASERTGPNTTCPGSRLLFPTLCKPTAPVASSAVTPRTDRPD